VGSFFELPAIYGSLIPSKHINLFFDDSGRFLYHTNHSRLIDSQGGSLRASLILSTCCFDGVFSQTKMTKVIHCDKIVQLLLF